MPDRQVDVLLVGGGVGSASCAAALRDAGFGGSVLLVGREPDPPYDRPPISKDYLAGTSGREEALYHPDAWYPDHDVELLSRVSVMKLDAAAREATLSTKETIGFGQALVATGANVRRLPVEGSDLDGIHYLRTLRNADALREDVADAERVVMVGGSYIGSEVAATLTALGKRCTIVMQEDVVLSTGFGPTAGRFFQDVLQSHGVEVVGSEEVARLEGVDGRVTRVVCASGRNLDADAVVFGVGAVPDVMLARGAGLELAQRGGVRCDSRLRTSAAGVFAAGDVCEYDSAMHGGRLRIEHWDVAIEQGRTVASNMMGADRAHEVVPYFFSDLSDWAAIEYVGPALEGWDDEILRGSMEDGAFSIWHVKEGRVAAALGVGRSADVEQARRLIAGRVAVGGRLGELGDLSSDLSAL